MKKLILIALIASACGGGGVGAGGHRFIPQGYARTGLCQCHGARCIQLVKLPYMYDYTHIGVCVQVENV